MVTSLALVVSAWSKYISRRAESIFVPDGISLSGNLISERAMPVSVLPADSFQVVLKFVVAWSDRTIVSWESVGEGAMVIVGSMTTGYWRPLAASHFVSGVTVSFQDLPSRVRFWVTLVL